MKNTFFLLYVFAMNFLEPILSYAKIETQKMLTL